MKKLMTAVAVALAAIATNAATYSWQAGADWVSADGENALEVMAYVFDANAYSLASVTTALGSGNKSILDNAIGSGVISDEGWFLFLGDGLTDNGGTPLTASMYTIFLDSSDAGAAAHYYATSVVSAEITDAVIADKAVFFFGDDIETGPVSSWTSIGGGPLPPEPTPEPTSGLLLLLGLSGLALRRRRA